MGRPPIEQYKVQNIERIWLLNQNGSALKIYEEARKRFPIGELPHLRKTNDIVKALKDKGPIKLLGPDPVIQPWGERWLGRPDELETLFVLHYTAKSVAQSFSDGITDRQADWACRLRGLFDLSKKWDALLLLWFSIQYSELERDGEKLGYKEEEFYTENFDLNLLEWTGRFPLRYPENESIPEEVTIKEWVISYFKAVSEGRQYFWVL